jgi:YegS/Rv2252/BmrU family lipid kinase
MQSWFFIINPFSGGQQARKRWPQLQWALEQEDIAYNYCFTESHSHAITLAQQAANSGERNFVAVGGDGTVNEVLQGLCQSEVDISAFILTVMPWGTGNDWATLHGISSDIDRFIRSLKQARVIEHDIGLASFGNDFQQQRYFINFIGTGFDSFLLQTMGAASGKRYKYYLTLLLCLHRYCSPSFSVSHQDSQYNSRSLMLMACIGKYGGAGMKFAPDAKFNDGLFELLNIQDMPFLQRLLSLPYLINGKIKQHKKVINGQMAELEFSSGSPFKFQCDGELIAHIPVKITCLKKAIKVLSNQ